MAPSAQAGSSRATWNDTEAAQGFRWVTQATPVSDTVAKAGRTLVPPALSPCPKPDGVTVEFGTNFASDRTIPGTTLLTPIP
jgi:hypothetical protein